MKRLAAAVLAVVCIAAAPAPVFDASTRTQTIAALEKALDGYVFVAKVPAIRAAIEAHRSQLEATTGPIAFSDAATKILYAASHDKHLGLSYSPEVIPQQNPDRMKPSAAELAQEQAFFRYMDYGFESSARLPGNIGYLRVGGFPNYPMANATLASTMSLMSTTDALIVDMRGNGGGDPKTVNYLLAYFFAKRTEVTGFLWRKGNAMTAERVFTPAISGPRYLSKPVFVLTDDRTISGGEQFCYDLQALHRATLIGATTAGGANIGGDVRLNDHFSVFIPVGTARDPYTKSNWEGAGVKPDVAVSPHAALRDAYVRALKAAADPLDGSAGARARALKDPSKSLQSVFPQ